MDEVSYEVRKTHLIDFSISNIKNSEEIKKTLKIQRFMTPLVFLFFTLLIGSSRNEVTKWLIIFGAVYVSWVIIYPIWYMWSVKRNVNKNINKISDKEVVGNCKLIIESDGLLEESNSREHKTRWKYIVRLVETKDYIFIYNAENSAYVVPIKAFENESDKNDYLNKLKNYTKREIEAWEQ